MSKLEHHGRLIGRRSLVGGVFSMGSLAALAGCVHDAASSDGGSATVAEEDPELPFSVSAGAPSCIDPYNCRGAADKQVVWQLFDPLTVFDYEAGEPVGLAAESWEVSDDACTYTFHLRSGATFHNGEAVTAASFKRGWERVVNPQSSVARLFGASQAAYHLALVEGYAALAAGETTTLAGLSCPDEETLEVTLSQAYADFPTVVAHPALSPVPYQAQADPEAFYYAPVGNGPFMLSDGFVWDGAGDIELTRFEGYPGEPATVDGVVLRVSDDVDALYEEFDADELDVAEIPVDEVSSVKKACGLSEDGCTMDADGRLVMGSELTTMFLVCNTAAEPLESAVVRRAISLAIDRDYLSDSVYVGMHAPADDIVPPGVPGYRAGSWPYATHDAERAQALLEALYPSDEEGVRELELTLTYYADGGHDEVVGALADDLRKVGITLEENAVSWQAMVTRLTEGAFELALFSWTPDYPLIDTVLYPLLHSKAAGGCNYAAYADDDVDAAIDEARTLTDAAERLARYQDADELVAADVPLIPLVYGGHAVAASERVESLYRTPERRLCLSEAVLA